MIRRPNSAVTILLVASICPLVFTNEAYANPAPSAKTQTDDMVLIKGGTFHMGTSDGADFEGPVHEVRVKSFRMDKHEVTVAEFGRFVQATGYKTDAEKRGWALAYNAKTDNFEKVQGANWRHPDDVSTPVNPEEPVTQVSWQDAVAFAQWAGKRLPTEAEWEFAARGGLDQQTYPWGNECRTPSGKAQANLLGDEDGYPGRAPVGKFAPNNYGLFDMAGNVWEWCADTFDTEFYSKSPKDNPVAPERRGYPRAMRGGSWLCGGNHCHSYRVAARGYGSPNSAMNHRGFRCVCDPRSP